LSIARQLPYRGMQTLAYKSKEEGSGGRNDYW
jgi:hypothetical protein